LIDAVGIGLGVVDHANGYNFVPIVAKHGASDSESYNNQSSFHSTQLPVVKSPERLYVFAQILAPLNVVFITFLPVIPAIEIMHERQTDSARMRVSIPQFPIAKYDKLGRIFLKAD